MSIVTHQGDAHLTLGDSTINLDSASPQTSWPGQPSQAGFFFNQLQTQALALPSKVSSSRVVGTGRSRVKAAAGTVRQGKGLGLLSFKNSGVNGQTTANCLANLATLVTAKGANVVWVTLGINDILTAVPVGTFATSYAAVLTGIRASLPNAKVVCSTIPCHFETWAAGPVWNNADDATVLAFNNAIIAAAAALSPGPATVVDFRTQLLPWEVVNNPGKAPSGVYTIDGVHPNDTGRTTAAGFALPSITVAP